MMSKESFDKFEKVTGKKPKIEKAMPVLNALENQIFEDFVTLCNFRSSGCSGLSTLKYSEVMDYFDRNYEMVGGFATIWLDIISKLDKVFLDYANKQQTKQYEKVRGQSKTKRSKR